MPTEFFKSKEAYRKNLAYRHIHGIPFTATRVVVGGRSHKVDHSRETPARRQINDAQREKVVRRQAARPTPRSTTNRSATRTSVRSSARSAARGGRR